MNYNDYKLCKTTQTSVNTVRWVLKHRPAQEARCFGTWLGLGLAAEAGRAGEAVAAADVTLASEMILFQFNSMQ